MSPLTIGLVFETFDTYAKRAGDPPDAMVEYEPESTIEALEAAIKAIGHRPHRVGSPQQLLEGLGRGEIEPGEVARSGSRSRPTDGGSGSVRIDAVFNVAEGAGTRNREGWAPTLLEMAGIPCLGSDALSLSLSLDKAWANRFLAAAGVPIAAQATFESGASAREANLPADFPLFVKPRWEGTAKGIRPSSKVSNRHELIAEIDHLCSTYQQSALVEAFVPGPEYTVTLVGNDPVEALPVVQRALDRATGIGLHALEGPGGSGEERAYEIPGRLAPELEAELADLARRVFSLLECRDFARVDFRLDAQDRPIFLEINPLPTFATDGTFAILAELEGISFSQMLGRCIEAGLARLGLGGEQPLDRAHSTHEATTVAGGDS